LFFEHEIDGAGQLDGQDGVGFELVAAHPRFRAVEQRSQDGIAFATTAASPKAQRRYGLPSLAPRRPLILPALATVPLTSRQ